METKQLNNSLNGIQPQTIIIEKKSNTSKYLIFTCLGLTAFFFMCCIGSFVLLPLLSPKDQQSEVQDSAKTTFLTEEQRNEYAKTYCGNRKSDKNINYPTVKRISTGNGYDYSGMKSGDKLTTEDCNLTIEMLDQLQVKGDFQIMTQIVGKKFWAGMRENQLLASIGLPNKTNIVYDDGVTRKEQLIYNLNGNKTRYVYLENSEVTSFQEF